MRRKRLKQREKLGNFEQWELDFMREGPPPYEQQMRSGHGFAYLSGIEIWRRLQVNPGFKAEDWPLAKRAFRNI